MGTELLEDNIHTFVKEQVAMFLHVMGHNHVFRVIHNTFRRSMTIVSLYWKQVFYAVGKLIGDMIKQPTSCTPPKIKNNNLMDIFQGDRSFSSFFASKGILWSQT
jgi:hypothetical protein